MFLATMATHELHVLDQKYQKLHSQFVVSCNYTQLGFPFAGPLLGASGASRRWGCRVVFWSCEWYRGGTLETPVPFESFEVIVMDQKMPTKPQNSWFCLVLTTVSICINHPMLEYRGYLILTHAIPCPISRCCCWELKREEHFEFWLLRSTYLAFVCIVLLSSLFHANCDRYREWYEQYLSIFGSQFSWASGMNHIFPHLSTCSGGCILFSDPLRGRCLSLSESCEGWDCLRYCSA